MVISILAHLTLGLSEEGIYYDTSDTAEHMKSL